MARSSKQNDLDWLVTQHLSSALRFATRLTGTVAAAEDVLQEALVRVARTQKWSTTASIPHGVPVLIGSATLTNTNDDAEKLVGGARRELSLVIEIHAN